MLNQISVSRKLSVDTLNAYADEMMMFQPTEKSKQYALVDSLVYADEVDSILNKYVADYEIVKHAALTKAPDNKKIEKEKVALIYAVGGIDGGDGEGIVSEDLVETINDVAKDESVKAVVLRVSSGSSVRFQSLSFTAPTGRAARRNWWFVAVMGMSFCAVEGSAKPFQRHASQCRNWLIAWVVHS